MGLAGVLQTSLSGLLAAEQTIQTAANNLANSQTNGFKQQRAQFSSQTPRTAARGQSQIGTGVQVSGSVTDFSQGSIASDPSPSSLAIEGRGLFILENSASGRRYARGGQLQLNAQKQLVTSTGKRVLGHGVDEKFNLRRDQLVALKIPLGKLAPSADRSSATLTDFSIAQDGRIRGKFSDGTSRDLGQIRIANFANPQGLVSHADSEFSESPSSGSPTDSDPGEEGAGELVSGSVELSNTDVGQNLIDLVRSETQFRANLDVMSTSAELLDELTTLVRR